MVIVTFFKLLSCRQSIVTVLLYIIALLITDVAASNIANLQQCSTDQYKPTFGCNDTITSISNSGNFIIQYVSFGNVECSGGYTLRQTRTIPNVTLLSAEPGSYYTILMVDTSDTP